MTSRNIIQMDPAAEKQSRKHQPQVCPAKTKQPACLSMLVSGYETLRQENQELKDTIEEMSSAVTLAYRDVLTGLHNRRFFNERIWEEIHRARRNTCYVFSLVIIDINDFKEINDRRGHKEGDRVLCWVSEFLASSVRHDDICCRLGGDEFVIIIPGGNQGSCKRLRNRLRTCQKSSSESINVEVSLAIGSATYNQHGSTIEDLFEYADQAMYQDKKRQKAIISLQKFVDVHQRNKKDNPSQTGHGSKLVQWIPSLKALEGM